MALARTEGAALLSMLALGQRDDAADVYLAQFTTDASRRVARSNLEVAGRALIGWPAPVRPKRIGAKSLHVDLARVPWSSISPQQAARVRDVVLQGGRSRRAASAVCGALRGALRAAGVLTIAHLDALKIDQQGIGVGRSVAQVIALWDDGEDDNDGVFVGELYETRD